MRTLVLLLERTELASRALVHSVVARPRPGRLRGSLPLSALLRQHPPPLPLWARRRHQGAELPGHDGPPSRVEKSVEPCRTTDRLQLSVILSVILLVVLKFRPSYWSVEPRPTRRVINSSSHFCRVAAPLPQYFGAFREPFWRGLSQARSLEGRARGRVPGLTRWRRNEAKRP